MLVPSIRLIYKRKEDLFPPSFWLYKLRHMDFVNCFVKSIVSKGKDVLDSAVYMEKKQTRIGKNSVISVLPESEPAICKRLRWNNWQIKHVLSPRWARHPKMIEIEAKVLNRYGYIWPSTLQNTVPKADVNESTTCVTSFSPEFTVTSTLISFIIPGTVIIFCNVEIIFIGKKLFKREKQRILHYPSPGRYLTYSWPISYGVSFRVKHRSRFFNIFSLSSKN